MSFISLSYFGLFLTTLALLALIRKPKSQKLVLLAASSVFYGLWDWRFLGLLFGITFFTHFCANQILHGDKAHKKLWLILQIAGSLGVLGFFKYTNFFISSIAPAFESVGWQTATLNVILPVGISFVVFEVISYTVDAFKGDLGSEPDLLDISLLVFFFPHLVSGPILKPKHFLPQLQKRIIVTPGNLSAGAQLFLWGMVKKMLVADRLAPAVDAAFAHPGSFHPWALWIGLFSYGLQIYGDFSGYTDMAIGSAKCMGLEIPQNFRLPYLSANITEFWRRWHISLSTWLRDYLYIPLGGSRLGVNRTYFNLFVVMVLGGLWHGAAWGFILWGAVHGSGLVIHKLFSAKKLFAPNPASIILGWAVTVLFVMLAWVPFRASTFAQGMTYFTTLFSWPSESQIKWFSVAPLFAIPCLAVADYLSMRWHEGNRLHLTKFWHQLLFFLILLSILALGPPATSPFIYFQF